VQYGNATDYFYSLNQLTSRYKLETQQMQAGLGAGKWGPLQGEEQVQWLGVQSCGMGDPIYQAPLFNVEQTADATPLMPGLGRLTLTESSDVDVWNPLLGGHQEQVQQHGTMGAPCCFVSNRQIKIQVIND
jgi:hypothetical protein